MAARVKITDAMIDAGVVAFREYAEDRAIEAGEPLPDFDDIPDEAKAMHRGVIKAILRAGADAI